MEMINNINLQVVVLKKIIKVKIKIFIILNIHSNYNQIKNYKLKQNNKI